MSEPTVPPRWRRNTTLFLAGQTSSLFGSLVVQYVVMWWVTFETRSGTAVALWAIAAMLPQAVVSLFGGVLADRMNRKVLVMLSDAGIAAATLALALVMSLGVTDLWILLLAVAVRSVGAGVQIPAVQALIPQIVPGEELMRINGTFQSIQSGMMLLAPAVAGALYAGVGIVPAFYLDVVTALLGIGLLALVPVPTLARVAEQATSYRADLVEGARYIWTTGLVRWLLVVFALIFALTVSPNMVTPLMVARTFGDEVWMVTVLEICFSAGMLLSGLIVATVLAKRSPIVLILFATFGSAVITVGLGLSPNLWVFFTLMFLFGLLMPLFSAPFMTLIQETVPAEKHGRVFSYVGIVMGTAGPVGIAVVGPLADVVSVQLLLVVGGTLTALVMVVATLLPSGRAAIEIGRRKPTTQPAPP